MTASKKFNVITRAYLSSTKLNSTEMRFVEPKIIILIYFRKKLTSYTPREPVAEPIAQTNTLPLGETSAFMILNK